MGRKCHLQKEMALEALFQILKSKNLPKRPDPTSMMFYLVKNAIHIWKSSPSNPADYWDSQKLATPEKSRERRLLLQTISTWFDRRRNKKHPSKALDPEALAKCIEIIETRGTKESEVSTKKKPSKEVFTKADIIKELCILKEENEMLKAQVRYLKNKRRRRGSFDLFTSYPKRCRKTVDTTQCNTARTEPYTNENRPLASECIGDLANRISRLEQQYVPLLHQSPHCESPHLDYLVNGRIECQHQNQGCCSKDDKLSGSFDFLGPDMTTDEIVALLD